MRLAGAMQITTGQASNKTLLWSLARQGVDVREGRRESFDIIPRVKFPLDFSTFSSKIAPEFSEKQPTDTGRSLRTVSCIDNNILHISERVLGYILSAPIAAKAERPAHWWVLTSWISWLFQAEGRRNAVRHFYRLDIGLDSSSAAQNI